MRKMFAGAAIFGGYPLLKGEWDQRNAAHTLLSTRIPLAIVHGQQDDVQNLWLGSSVIALWNLCSLPFEYGSAAKRSAARVHIRSRQSEIL